MGTVIKAIVKDHICKKYIVSCLCKCYMHNYLYKHMRTRSETEKRTQSQKFPYEFSRIAFLQCTSGVRMATSEAILNKQELY